MNKELLDKAIHQIENPKENLYLKTGFDDLDILLSEVENGSLITIGSKPAMGKKSLAYSIMLNLLKENKKCLFFSMSRNNTIVVKHLLSQETEIYLERILNGNILPSDKIKIDNIRANFLDYKLIIDDKSLVTIEYLKEKIVENKPQFVFIDSIQLMEENLDFAQGKNILDISKELKNIAIKNNCIIFVLSSVTRGIETRKDKRPLLCDLKIKSLVDFSDVIMFIYRNEYYNENPDLSNDEAEITIAKNQFGLVATAKLLFNSSFAKFQNLIKTNEF